MLKALRRRRPRPEAPPFDIDIVFLDEPEDERDEVDTFMHVPIMPRVGETVMLDGDFRRRGAFVVERVEHRALYKRIGARDRPKLSRTQSLFDISFDPRL